MELQLVLILALLFMATTGCKANHPSKDYWNSVLPATVMPKAIEDIIAPVDTENLSLPKDLSVQFLGDGKVKYDGIADFSDTEAHLFLLEKDIFPGKQLEVEFADRCKANFLPRKVAESLPFTSSKILEILKIFSVKPDSIEARNMENVLRDCEQPPNEGELQFCATSMEAMVDFCISVLGRNVSAFSTQIAGETRIMKTYNMTSEIHQLGSGRSVVCHKLNYAYAVFKCHEVPNTAAYAVALIGIDGTYVNAVVVCHRDTTTWGPNHFAFRVLNVERGTVPVCHFTVEQTVLWVEN